MDNDARLQAYKDFIEAEIAYYQQAYEDTVGEFGADCADANILYGQIMGLELARDNI